MAESPVHSETGSNQFVMNSKIWRKRVLKALVELIVMEMLPFEFGERPSFVRFMQGSKDRLFDMIDDKIALREADKRYELEVAAVAELIIMEGLPLNFGARYSFVLFMQRVVNPFYKGIEKKVVIGEAKQRYEELKEDLSCTLCHKVALACDVWHNENVLTFIRITAHWIDHDWLMHRRIINFKMHPAESQPILESIDEWGIKEMIFSVTFDEVLDSPEVTDAVKNAVRPILDGKIFRVRCACRALSLCVQKGLKLVDKHITRIRNVFGLGNHETWSKTFGDIGEKYYKSMMIDDCNWDTTAEMLKTRLQYKDVITEFIASNWPGDEQIAISEQDWEIASIYCSFLGAFSEAVDCISRNYYPSSCGILLYLVNIAKLFSEHRGTVLFKEHLYVMEETFLKHFERIPDLYSLAAIMDPRIKLSGCECLLESFYQFSDNMEVNVEEEKLNLSHSLHEMYSIYASQFSHGQKPSSPEPSGSLSTRGFAWSLISRKKQKTADSALNELTSYLQTHHTFFRDENKEFDILTWWKKHEVVYPVLAKMAHDLLTTPVSTLAPDCAFRINEGREIPGVGFELRGRKLEVYSCVKDWLHANWRTQGERVRYDDDDDDDPEDDPDMGF